MVKPATSHCAYGEQVVAHPGRGQVRDHVVAGAQLVDLHPALGRADEAGVRLAHPFGLAGGARGVEDDRHILSLDTRWPCFPHTRVVVIPGGTELLQLCGADEPGLVVFAQTARVVVNDVGDAGHGFAHFQQLVHLLLVFGKRKVRCQHPPSQNAISWATASWYSGMGTAPRLCTAAKPM